MPVLTGLQGDLLDAYFCGLPPDNLELTYPLHVVCAWIGTTRAVAAKHYLQVTDGDFDRGSRVGAQAAQNPAQQAR